MTWHEPPPPLLLIVKFAALLVLPASDTVTLTLPPGMFGTVTVREVAVAAVTVPPAVPKLTVLAMAVVLKFVPVMVIDAPGSAEAGLIDVMVGAGGPLLLTVKFAALLVLPPTETVTLTLPAGMFGTVTVREVAVAAVTVPPAVPKFTVLALAVALKFVPVMVIDAPGSAEAGLIDVMVGAGGPLLLTVKFAALLVLPPTETVTLTLPAGMFGTVTVREVVVAAVTVPPARSEERRVG